MKIIVQKFGGTSVSTRDRRKMVINKIVECKRSGKSVVVVLSAMGRKGEPYATDTLKDLISTSYSGHSLKTMDLMMSCGEIISSALLGAGLESMGEKVVILTGSQAGILTDSVFGDADILAIEEERILSHLKAGAIVIVTGFQGATEYGEITTLGRGGSDTTAVALGVALCAESVEIYTDVDGIMTADPTIVSNAKIIDELSYDEVFQMAEKGAKVIHPRAVEIAKKGSLLIKIKNTMSSHPGTRIHHCKYTGKDLYSTRHDANNLLTAITSKSRISQVCILTEEYLESENALFTALAEAGISIDMINFFINQKVFTVDDDKSDLVEEILQSFQVQYTLTRACSKVTAVGNRIAGIPGVMATIVTALSKEKIPILQSSDSHSTISLLVNSCDETSTLKLLHQAFSLDKKNP
ncbi:aspartate kinase [Alkaliphilus oremlandii]|uniref:Aspartokinase n=1 Tax=Alkaliphilus oremlandii (strain OhILAs) TaxID=350688 RepID=A8MLJ3_ALKOO|nr:aspartate kinase [Alkaliphilus oremlandii]ABW18107.1 aspartate kinase [Alkaliphilus oremlandii OhILAs]